MTKKKLEWPQEPIGKMPNPLYDRCNSCWTCRSKIFTKYWTIRCGFEWPSKVLTSKDIMASPDCPHRVKMPEEQWEAER
jgi:hypothetical protein